MNLRYFFAPSRLPVRVFGTLILALGLLAAAACSPQEAEVAPNVAAIERIREALELPNLPLTYTGMGSMGNSPSGSLPVALYEDSVGRVYSVDPVSAQVVEIDARSVLPSIPANASLLPAEIDARAMKFIRAVIPNFDALQSGWTYETGGKVDNYFYSWYAPIQRGASMAPFAQLALHKSGILFAYINTLFLDQ